MNLRNSTVTPHDFFYRGSKIVSFYPAKGRPVHALNSSFFWRLVKCAPQAGTVDPTFTGVVFGVFSLADFPVNAIAKSTEELLEFYLLFILTKLFLVFMCNGNYGVSVCVCVCVSAFLLRADIITVNFSAILFLISFHSEMKR